ncbi:hypothetical protein BK666_28305 [Pseudomonas frederiksbergensis]|uniref:Uncharacterized protein n=1 Tax=Pseudomonas frederiksbergensis TaxID=104087 RepID=A0A423JN72_9PSED|nr:hypothetical protein [Pseudomonas frederiksbergensis]RON39150.1 hypothetical protein BK666_28305 [Pseudomonas frederiksbergensis]
MEERIYEVLHGVPVNADYAVDATDLDAEDIPQSRIDDVMDLLGNKQGSEDNFLAAKLLASWGYQEGLFALNRYVDDLGSVAGLIIHRIYGYDDTYRFILLALTGYFASVSDKGEATRAREDIYNPISKIILFSNAASFEISDFFWLVEKKGFLEYVPALREHLIEIIDQSEVRRWKINDVIRLLSKVDHGFVSSFLQLKGKVVGDFNV